VGSGIGHDIVAAYNWISQPLFTIDLPIHLPHPIKKAENALDGAIDSTVRDILQATGLLSILQEVTGKPEPLAQAADVWLEQAHHTKAVADELRQAARPLPQSWQGAASAAFGNHMGQLVNALDAMAGDMGTAASILNQAAQECQVAEDLVNEIIREAIEFALATLAATAVADIFTFGLATIAGGIAEGAEMTAFVARAAQVSTKLAEVLDRLLEELSRIRALKDAKSTWSAFKEFQRAKSIFQAFKAVKRGDGTLLATNRALHLATGVVKSAVVAPALGVAGLEPDPISGAKDVLTGSDGLGATATTIDAVTGTGKPAEPYHLPERHLAAELDNLTAVQPTGHTALNLD
jgi:WXG100 family type VII secretion target